MEGPPEAGEAMKLTGLHILLAYECNYPFLYPETRATLRGRLPEILGPAQMYGVV